MSVGFLPSSWSWARVTDIGQVSGGVTKNAGKRTTLRVPYLRVANVYSNELRLHDISEIGINDAELPRLLLRPGDLLVVEGNGSLDQIGRVAVWRGAIDPCVHQNHLIKVRFDQNINEDFVKYWLLSPVGRQHVTRVASSTTGLHTLSISKVEGLPVAVAPPSEQQRIVDAVDALLSRLDAAVATLEAAQKKLKAYRASVLKAAVEGRIVPTEAALARAEKRDFELADVLLKRILSERRRHWEGAELAKMNAAGKSPKDEKWKAKYKEPDPPDTKGLPELPTGWSWSNVEALSVLVTDGDHNPPKRVPSGVPHLTAKNIKDNRIVMAGCSFVTEKGFEQTKQRYEPLAGDIIVTCVGTLGETAVVPPGIVFSADRNLAAIRLVPNGMLARLALHWLNTMWVQQHLGIVSGSTAQPHLYLSDLRALPVPLPPGAEQGRICEEAERLLSASDAVMEQVAGAVRRAVRLRQAVLKWAFEGKLVDQDPNDEPADKILERIRAERATDTAKRPRRPRAAV